MTRASSCLLIILAWVLPALADTPPPRSVSSLTFDAAGNAITSTASGSHRGLDCNVTNALTAPGNAQLVVGGAAIDPRSIRALTTSDQISCAQLSTWNIANITGTISLPTNAAQETGGNLAAINSQVANLNSKVTAFDLDTSSGTQNVTGVSLRLSASGGSVEAGTAANPLRVDPTGTTTQPVSVSSLPLPAGAATSAAQATGNSSLASIDSKLSDTGAGALKVDGSSVTQPVSAASLPLPAGASTAALQTTGNTTLSSLNAKFGPIGQQLSASSAPVVIASDQSPIPISGSITATNPSIGTTGSSVPAMATYVGAINATGNLTGLGVDASGNLLTTVSGISGAVSLPTGASTSSLQTAANTFLSSIDGKTPALVSGRVPVDGSAVTQPVSAASLPLPAGAATSALQTAGNASLSSIATNTPALVSGRVPVDGSGVTQPVSGTVSVSNFPATQPVSGSVAVTNFPATQAVSAASLPLPTGAATAAKQPALGVAGTPSADVITVQGAASMTPLLVNGSAYTQPVSGSVSVSNFPATQPVSGAVAVSNFPATQAVTGTVTANVGTTGGLALDATVGNVQGSAAAGSAASKSTLIGGVYSTTPPSPTNGQQVALQINGSGALKTDSSAVIQPVSAASLPLPAGAATAALQSSGNASLATLATNSPPLVGGRVPVDGSGVTQPVSGSVSVSNFPATQPVSGTVTANQGGAPWTFTGTGTAGTPAAGVVSVQGIAGATAVKVDGSAVTQPVSAASLPLPAGAATSALQTGGNASLATLAANSPALVSGRIPVDGSGVTQPVSGTVAVNNFPATQAVSGTVAVSNFPSTQAISAASLPLPTNAAQETGGHLASLDAKTPALGSSTQAGSTPVVGPADFTSTAQNVTVQDTGSSTATQANNQQVITGTPTAGSYAVVAAPSIDTVMVVISGTWTGTLQVETSQNNGASWVPHSIHLIGSAIFQSAFTQNVQGSLNMAAKTHVRVRATAAMTGTASVTFTQSYNQSSVYVANSVKITDGSNTAVSTPLTVLPASTAAASTNTAAVVALSPNSPLPAGTASVGTFQPGNTPNTVPWLMTINQGGVSAAVTASNALKVDGSSVTQPVSAAALPLPTGAATSALQTAGNSSLASISSQLPASLGNKTMANSLSVSIASDQTPVPVSGSITATNASIGATGASVPASATYVAGLGSTGNLTGLSLDASSNLKTTVAGISGTVSLPTGAATSSLQTTGNTSLASIAANTPALVSGRVPVDGSGVTQPVSGSVSVSNFPTTQAVSGTVTATQGTSPWIVAGGGTAGTAATGVVTVQGIASMTPLLVNGSGVTQPVSGSVSVSNFPATQAVSGTVAVSNFPATQAISAASLPLPTGASTSAKQPALGTAGTASSDVLTVQGISGMTALKVDGSGVTQPVSGSISVSNFPATQTVSGTVTANIGTTGGLALDATVAKLNVAQGAAVGSNTGPMSQGVATTAAPAYTTATVNPLSLTLAGALRTDSSATTQPVSGSVSVANFPATQAISAASLPLPTGAATAAKQPALGTAGTASGDVITVQGIASMTPLLVNGSGVTQPVSGSVSVSNFPATQPVNGSVSVSNFPTTQAVSGTVTANQGGAPWTFTGTGAAGTAATGVLTVQGIAGATAVKVDGSAVTQPVSGTVSVSNFPATQAISAASLPLPAGASTSALQTTGNGYLSALNVGQGAATGTNTGPMVQGVATTASPAYTTATVNPLSLTLAGALRTDSSATTQPVSGTVSVGNFPATQPVSGSVSVSNFPSTQAISAASLPLPSGAATAAKQPALGTAGTPSADVLTVQGAASMTPLLVNGSGVTQPVSGSIAVTNFPATQPVSGTVTSNQGTSPWVVSGTVTANVGTTGGLALDATVAKLNIAQGAATGSNTGPLEQAVATSAAPAYTTATINPLSLTLAGALRTDSSATTQPISGAVSVSNFPATQTVAGSVSVSNFPATQAVTQSTTPWIVAGGGTAGSAATGVLTVQGIAGATAIKVDGSAVTQPISGSVSVSNFPATQPVSGTVTSNIGTTGGLALDASVGKLNIAQGAALGANTGPLGQAVATTASPSYTTATINPLSMTLAGALRTDASATTQPISGSVSVSNFPATQSVSGTVTANQGGAPWTVTGTGTAGSAASGVFTVQGIAGATAVKVDGSAVTQPVSAVSLPLPAGASTSALQTTGNASLASLNVSQGASTGSNTGPMVQGVATAAAPTYTTATVNPLSLTGAGALRTDASATTQPISAASLPLPAGAATAAKQPALGTAGTPSSDVITVQGAGSMTPLLVNGSAVTQPVSAASLPLPAGASTSALQTTMNTTLTTISGQLPAALGQTTAAASLPVTIATNQVAANMQIGTAAGLAQTSPLAATVTGYGTLRTSDENVSIFYDPFDSTLDTTIKWTTPITSGSATISQSTGGENLAGGTTASSFVQLVSQPTFVGLVPGFAQVGWANKFESGTPITNADRFWGVGSAPTTPTTTAPLTDAVGWEIGTDGALRAVVWAGGVQTVIANLSSSGTNKQPTDGNYHRYAMYMRTDRTFWYIDSLDVPVATSNFQFPNVQRLPLRAQIVNSTTAPSTSPTIMSTGVSVGDSGRSSVSISDGLNPFRKATIDGNGGVTTDPEIIGPGPNTAGERVTEGGRAYVTSARNVDSTTNIGTVSWVQLIASTPAQVEEWLIWESCGQTFELGAGASGSESRIAIIPPGGYEFPLRLHEPVGTRISVRALSNACTAGEFDITGLN